jgi:pimeloyl-ACP methyl ester carboxylesterase
MENYPTAELRKIETGLGLVFDVFVDGPAGAPLVLLLHGFAESFHMWRLQLPALAAAGYRAVAPSQRGYSAGARPDKADVANYQFDRLVADAMNVVAMCGYANSRFHLVGHDWGASIAWGIAHRSQRIQSRTVYAGWRTGAAFAAS